MCDADGHCDGGVTRLAPSPTGALHLGNARTFLLNHLLAVQNGWRTLLRIEDLDGPRVKPRAAEAMIDELRWLGLDWQGPTVYQSHRAGVYRQALNQLAACGAAYPCTCSRKDVQSAAGAPHAEDAHGPYPNICRGRYASAQQALEAAGRHPAWRLRADGEPVQFLDRFAGPQSFRLDRCGGDFVIFKNDGTAAYQLAVVIDDDAAGVNQVVRGQDLLESAARQIHLRRLLGIARHPTYWHLPLVVGPDGRRLAKRHGDTRLAHYRQAGATPQRVLGLLAWWSGLLDCRREACMPELAQKFDIRRVPNRPVAFGPQDDAFLLGR